MKKPALTVGDRYGKLVILDVIIGMGDIRSQTWGKCQCDCGNIVTKTACSIKQGQYCSRNCGLLKGPNKRKTDKINRTYNRIKQKCYNTKCSDYRKYGAKGIKMCDEWLNSKETFSTWCQEHGYSEELTIDRINNDGDYESGNCRWITHKQQQNNKKNNKYLTAFNETKTFADWLRDERCRVPYGVFRCRISQGMDVEQALTIPKGKTINRQHHMITAFGETKNIVDWSKDSRCVVGRQSIMRRIQQGKLSNEEIITLPRQYRTDVK